MSHLSLKALTAGYEAGLPIVREVELSVMPGEFVGIFGPNGAGKSTLVKAVAGIARTFGGEARLGAERLTGLKPHQVLARGLAFVPQTDNVFASLSIRENLLIAAAILPAAERKAAIRRVEERFPDLAVAPHRTAGSLSGGQRQMLACARALMVSPDVLVMDEPSAGLSPRLATEVFRMLAAINQSGITVVLVEQNVRAALTYVGRGVILVDGTVRLDAPAADLPDHADLGALFLGAAPATA